uniref:Putative transmembrane protein n=1 Tax=Toxoplasma gondii COUG TaxID=1074873 RepID=A0A2G8XNL5_TOXGO|nr:putative transmembrane protein [Toxoplasma gondii COUG]
MEDSSLPWLSHTGADDPHPSLPSRAVSSPLSSASLASPSSPSSASFSSLFSPCLASSLSPPSPSQSTASSSDSSLSPLSPPLPLFHLSPPRASSRPSHGDRLCLESLHHACPSSRRRLLSSKRNSFLRLPPLKLCVALVLGLSLHLRGVLGTVELPAQQVLSSPSEQEANVCRCLCDRASGLALQVLVPADKGCSDCTTQLCVDSFFSVCGPLDGKRDSSPPADVSAHCTNRRAPWSQWVILSFLIVTGSLLCFASLRAVAPSILDTNRRLFDLYPLPGFVAGHASPRPSYSATVSCPRDGSRAR